ncbi:MAG: hypothetical protein CO141_03215 [Candidatus Moranbacteria bacterium CG_4_9_14_3_um_filter_42_9]|nr:MAG: hypothetical protein CO141_03215 [Candidatus Moranbacteria bacterium CG_4_9_14_3_um_filter_42_9]
MNIYALEGFRIIVKAEAGSVVGGTEADKKQVKKYLKIGKIYTVAKTKVHNCHTDVHLKEVPGVKLNSTNFVDFESQSKEDDAKHPDWQLYN